MIVHRRNSVYDPSLFWRRVGERDVTSSDGFYRFSGRLDVDFFECALLCRSSALMRGTPTPAKPWNLGLLQHWKRFSLHSSTCCDSIVRTPECASLVGFRTQEVTPDH